jgi:hypothetical protein
MVTREGLRMMRRCLECGEEIGESWRTLCPRGCKGPLPEDRAGKLTDLEGSLAVLEQIERLIAKAGRIGQLILESTGRLTKRDMAWFRKTIADQRAEVERLKRESV